MLIEERRLHTGSFPPRFSFSERRLLLRLGDLLLISISIGVSLWIWLHLSKRSFTLDTLPVQINWIILIFFGWPIWLFFNDLYNLRRAVHTACVARIIVIGAIVLTIAYLGIFFITVRTPAIGPLNALTAEHDPLRLAPILSISISAMILLIWRIGYSMLLGGVHARRRVIVLGASPAALSMIKAVEQIHGNQYHFIGIVDDHDQGEICTVPSAPLLLGRSNQLVQLAVQHRADEIAVATSCNLPGHIIASLMDCHERGITITPLALIYEQAVGRVAVEHIGNEWYLALPLQQMGMTSLFRFIKRIMDVVGGMLLGVAFLLIFPAVAIAIKLDSRGPIFYRQERVGLHGRPFQVIKFRSMVVDAERDGQARWATKGDSRITRVGAFLRKTRLDELPQVINVIKGEMSLVGPRPERQQFIEQLQQQIPFYRARLAVKPGLTGWAQINYGYGATVKDALIKLQYDLFYIKHQSPWFDLTIMLRTIGVVLQMKGQ